MEADHGTYGYDIAVAFGLWLDREGLTLAQLRLDDVYRFVQQQPYDGTPIKAGTQNAHRHRVRHYLCYLYRHGFLHFDPAVIHGRRRKPVPELVERYVGLLRPLNRPSTLYGYRAELRQFHQWLDRQGHSLPEVNRHVVLEWLGHMHDVGWAAQRRINAIALVGRYLAWLCEEGVVADDPAGLLRAGDYPRKPQYLPRPVPPQADREIQKRLGESDDAAAKALPVMRRTGLRLGELRKLEHDCVRELPDGTPMLKVPLGKLYNERLVPMDAETRELVDSLCGPRTPTDTGSSKACVVDRSAHSASGPC
jgi:site-specific recombinase XerD